MRYLPLSIICLPLLAATASKPSPNDYPASRDFDRYTVAAEYLGHTVPAERQSFFVRDYLVIDIAFFPRKGEKVLVSAEKFRLQVNGKKPPLQTQSAGIVAGSLKWDDWTPRPRTVASVGDGNSGVVVGGPRPTPRFPGDPTTRPLPSPPRAPAPEDRSGIEKQEQQTADQAVTEESLFEGVIDGPMHGLLYFPYRGKLKSIRKLELIYGETVLAIPIP